MSKLIIVYAGLVGALFFGACSGEGADDVAGSELGSLAAALGVDGGADGGADGGETSSDE